MLHHSLITLALATRVLGHSWLEQLQLIAPNGSYAGDPGYARGYVARTDPSFNGYTDKWQLPSPDHDLGRTRINTTDLLCHPSQRTSNYTAQYPKLKVAAGSYVAMRYLENGHVTQPWIPAGKPAGSGTVFVYGTYSPSATEKIVDVLQWTSDGKGGSGQGFLIASQNFDDGRCHQPNSAPISIERQMKYPDVVPGQEAWCETDVHIPEDSKTGSTLSIYWVWSWQTSTSTEGAICGKDEYYTTCADVDVVDDSANDLYQAAKVHTLLQQDPQKTAVSDFQSRTADMSTPNLVTTEGCSLTTFTYSSLPATLTEMTSLPAKFLQTYSDSTMEATAPTTEAGPTVAISESVTSSASPTGPSSSTSPMATTTVTAWSVQTVTINPSITAASKTPSLAGAAGDGSVQVPVRRRADGFIA